MIEGKLKPGGDNLQKNRDVGVVKVENKSGQPHLRPAKMHLLLIRISGPPFVLIGNWR